MTPLTVTVSILSLFEARTTTGFMVASGSLATAGGKDTPVDTLVAIAGDATATGFCDNSFGSADAALWAIGGVMRTANTANSPTTEYVINRALRTVNPSVSE